MRIKVTERQFKMLVNNLNWLPPNITLQARAGFFKRIYGIGKRKDEV